MNAVHKIVIFVCYLKLYYCNVEDENLPCKERRICASCDWTGWSECSRSCGGGIKTRYRHYNVPVTWGNKEISNKCSTSDSVTKEVKQCGEICMNGGTYINQDNQRCLCGKHFDGPCCEEGLGFERTPFRNKMEANKFLRKRRVKRSLNEECGESGSCSYEEVREVYPGWGRPSICNFFKQRQCGNIYCHPGTYCDTLNDGGCSRLSNYVVHCKDVNECNSSPCRHGGTCHNEHNRFRCTCDPHFYGTTCQNICPGVANCRAVKCTDHSNSQCTACNDGYRLVHGLCEAVCSPQCSNGGTCIRPGECLCTIGYKGDFCEQAICEPECENNGTCVSPGTCDCSYGYFGERCELGGNVDEYLKPKKEMTNPNEGNLDSWYEFSEWYPYGKVCFVKINVRGAEKETLLVAISSSNIFSTFTSYGNYTVAPTDESFSINSTNRASCLEFRCPNNDESVHVEISTITKSKHCRPEFYETFGLAVKATNGTLLITVKSNDDYGPLYGIYKGFGTRTHASFSASARCFAGNNYGSDVMRPGVGSMFSYNCS